MGKSRQAREMGLLPPDENLVYSRAKAWAAQGGCAEGWCRWLVGLRGGPSGNANEDGQRGGLFFTWVVGGLRQKGSDGWP